MAGQYSHCIIIMHRDRVLYKDVYILHKTVSYIKKSLFLQTNVRNVFGFKSFIFYWCRSVITADNPVLPFIFAGSKGYLNYNNKEECVLSSFFAPIVNLILVLMLHIYFKSRARIVNGLLMGRMFYSLLETTQRNSRNLISNY